MNVKGTAIIVIPLFVQRRFGPEGHRAWLERLPPASREPFETSVLISRWYDLRDAFIEPTRCICDLFFDGDSRGAWECGRFSADYSLHGIYKAMVRIGSPGFLIGRGSRMFSIYYDSAEMASEQPAKGMVVMRITAFAEPHDLVEKRIGGWMERALEISGCKNVKVERTKSMASGHDITEFLMTWK